MVVVGRIPWNKLPSIGKAGDDLLEAGDRWETWKFVTTAGNSALATWTYHPAGRGFRVKAESIGVRLLLESSPSLLDNHVNPGSDDLA